MKLLFLQENIFYESLGLQAISAAVKAQGHQCDLLVESEESDLLDKIREAAPDMLGFSFMTRQQEWAICTINRIRRVLGIPILIGGTHPTMYPETLGHCEADYLCVGEGEGPTTELLNRLSRGQRTDDIRNLHAKINGRILTNDIRPLIQDWDALPTPDRDLYRRYPILQQAPVKRFVTSMGCAYRCSFCYINNFRKVYSGKGKFYRRKSVASVLREMSEARQTSPLRRVHFVDDLFSLDIRWIREFLPAFWREIRVPWTANVWIGHMDEETVRFYKRHGCAGVAFGVESGSERTRFDLIDKPILDATFQEHCGYLVRHRIPFHANNIIGLPGEGLEEAFETARFNRDIGARFARTHMFWPFPGTKLTGWAIDHGFLSSDYSVEEFNRGRYPKVRNAETEELLALTKIFPLLARWGWLEKPIRRLLKHPQSPLVRFLGEATDRFLWLEEARFFGLLNWSGLKLYWHMRRALSRLTQNAPNSRSSDDAEAQRPFWNISRRDTERVY